MTGLLLRLALAACLAVLATGAEATGSMLCEAVGDGGAFIDINVGQAAVESPTWVRIGIGDETWSSREEDIADGAKRILVVQHFADATRFDLDIADENQERIVASLRIIRASEGDDFVEAGYLAFPGRGAYAVTCIE